MPVAVAVTLDTRAVQGALLAHVVDASAVSRGLPLHVDISPTSGKQMVLPFKNCARQAQSVAVPVRQPPRSGAACRQCRGSASSIAARLSLLAPAMGHQPSVYAVHVGTDAHFSPDSEHRPLRGRFIAKVSAAP